MRNYIFFLIMLGLVNNLSAQTTIQGKIVSQDDKAAIESAYIRIKGTNRIVLTDMEGKFAIEVGNRDTLTVSHIGFHPKQLLPPYINNVIVELISIDNTLKEITVSTGYQVLPKDRATGSFVLVNNELINRSVSTNIIDRLKDVVPGLSFNNVGGSQLSIRGQTTIFGNAEPLIVIDNFPFDGNLQDINPNDVENITILKDAAAASIWGARAGNGVIVITSKKGKNNSPVQIGFNSNITIGEKPDLYVRDRLSSTDYIDIETRLFNEGFYNAAILTGYQPLTPVVDLLNQRKNNPGNQNIINAQIEALRSLDVRKDFEKYLYQKSVYQQYSFNLNGGSNFNTYFISAGLDKNKENLINNGYDRITINAVNNLKLFDDKLEVNTGINYIDNSIQNNNQGINISSGTGNTIYPYARLADEFGNPLNIVKDYSNGFIKSAQESGLLNWGYAPLNEIGFSDYTTKRKNTRLSSSIKYKIIPDLSVSALYQYTDINASSKNHRSQDTYFTRDLINRFTQVNGTAIIRPIPLGGILDLSDQSSVNNTFRLQTDFNKSFSQKHQISALGGFEVRDTKLQNRQFRYYGYDSEYARNGYVDYVNNTYPLYFDNSRKSAIPNIDGTGEFRDRYRSLFFNGSYTYDNRIVVSASARLDQSNLFGVKTNQKGVPLWSAGLSWNISNERFYKLDFLPYLKLRTTYGYNGSVNKSVTAFTTASVSGVNLYQSPYATIINPPNPELRWERVQILNSGIDFSTKSNRISGTIEYYFKRGIDLIGDTPMPPSSGILLFRGNTANTSGNGMDVSLSTKNLNNAFKWSTDFTYSFIREKVTSYNVTAKASGGTGYIQSPFISPLSGKPLYSIYSYEWAGLNAQTGDPMGYVNGNVSNDYISIFNSTNVDNMIFGGSRRPTHFGGLRNTFQYKQVSLSFNVSFRLGYYFRNSSISYGNDYGLSANSGDYALRWQKSGDENYTTVPSIPTNPNSNRDVFYNNANILVSKGDNIRLQDIRLSYDFQKLNRFVIPFKTAQIYLYANNLTLLWKATKFDVDPDNLFGNTPLTVAFGLKVNL